MAPLLAEILLLRQWRFGAGGSTGRTVGGQGIQAGTDIPGRDEKTVRNISCGFFCPGQGIAECVDNQ